MIVAAGGFFILRLVLLISTAIVATYKNPNTKDTKLTANIVTASFFIPHIF
jgi:hypothetical protein